MTDDNRFDVLDSGAAEVAKPSGGGTPKEEPKPAKPAGQPTPPQPLQEKVPGPGFAADPQAPASGQDRGPRRRLKRPAEVDLSTPRGRGARKPAAAKTAKVRKDGVFLLFRPGFLMLVGAVLLAVLWGGGFFAHTDQGRAAWPWELFLVDGDLNFQWTADHIETLLGAFFVVFFLFGAITPARAGRGVAVLTVAALGLMLKPPSESDYVVYLGYLLLALGVASILQRQGLRGGHGGRALVFVMVILLAASLFFPSPTSGDGYDSEALRVWNAIAGEAALGDTLQDATSQVVILQFVVLLVALLALFGASGGWMVWVAGVALYVAVLAPLTIAAIDYWGQEGEGGCLGLHQALVAALPAAFLAFVLPTTAGAVDATRDPALP